jgi:tetratricopeptide (TPR) repeat protein
MAQITIQQAFDLALQHHQAGRLFEAEHLGVIAHQTGRSDNSLDLIRRAIALNPNYAEAHNNLGNVLKDKGQLDDAIMAWHQAIALNPNLPDAHGNLGAALKDKGHLDEAIAAYRRAIALNPKYAEAHTNLGSALRDKGQLDDAIAAHRQAIALNPRFAAAHNNLGVALRDKGQLDDAIAAYREAIALNPNSSDAYSNLGNVLKDQRRLDDAIAAHRQAIALRPNFAEAQSNLAAALKDNGLLDDAIAAYRQAIFLRPNYAEAHTNLGNALKDKGRLEEAIAACRQVVALYPNSPEAHSNLGTALQDHGLLDDAGAAYRQAIALNPNLAEAHYNLSLLFLARGDFPPGWEEYEWRRKRQSVPFSLSGFAEPKWDGRPLEGRTLLLHAEQGFGDSIQFIRYLPMVAQRGGKIIIECRANLQRLFQMMAGKCQVVASGQPMPAFDLHCPLLSLPGVFGTTLATIPNIVPYLEADAEDVRSWRRRLSEHSQVVKVGLVWAGSPVHKNDRNRSIKLASLAPLRKAPGVCFFSLQKGNAAAEAHSPHSDMELVDWSEELKDFADTAALIANLDLVIGVDTAVVHLAGAMGKPVWTLLPFAADWRWLLNREDNPWYPSMRLFRQSSWGDWGGVITRVAEALSLWTKNRA